MKQKPPCLPNSWKNGSPTMLATNAQPQIAAGSLYASNNTFLLEFTTMRLMKLAAARRELFRREQPPINLVTETLGSVRRSSTRKINGVWWVDADVLELTTGDLIADAILMESLDGASA